MCACFCIEMDLSKDYPTEIYVGTESKGGFQPVKLENRPVFCTGCNKMGHVFNSCRCNPDSSYNSKVSSRQEKKKDKLHTIGELQNKAGKAKGKRVWKPTGKIFSVDEIFSEIQNDVPVSKVFSRLKEGLVTCDCEEFLWDEDLDVRRMLALVFSEEDTSGHHVGREEPQDQAGGGQVSVV